MRQPRKRGQKMSQLLAFVSKRMPFLKPARFIAVAACYLTAGWSGWADEPFAPQGMEYSLSGALLGDQVEASVAVGPTGGLLVWEDNFTDGDGSGISARRLDSSFSGILSSFRVNENGVGNQQKPSVALLSNGGAAVVWESEQGADTDIYLRCYSPAFTNYGGDVLVNPYTLDQQNECAVAALDGGDFVVVWASYNQVGATSLKDVYFRRFNSTGGPLGGAVLANQTTALNQRSPEVCKLGDGTFLVVWIGETISVIGGTNEIANVDVMARRFSSSGTALGNEFKVNTAPNLCANPVVASSSGSGFAVAWSEKNPVNISNSWDVVARTYAAAGGAGTTPITLNARLYGDQFRPQIASIGADYFVVWTSLRQDLSHEGVFGRFLLGTGVVAGAELQVNTTVINKQILPVVASDGGTRFLAVWSSFNGIAAGFDLFAQRYASVTEPLLPPDPPYAWPLDFANISVAWPELSGFAVAAYHVHVDGAATPTAVLTENQWTLTNMAPNSTHTFRLAYALEDGRTSPLSEAASATTYGQYGTITYGDVVPFDWMVANWGLNFAAWPEDVHGDSDGDGASDESEFLAGTDPKDPNSVLRTSLQSTPQGYFLNWNTEPGRIYQVQTSVDFTTWSDFGGRRFAAGTVDSLRVGGSGSGLFRVVLVRN